jgi:hypothetical protein
MANIKNDNDYNIQVFKEDDFVYTAGKGENGENTIFAGGFEVGSLFLKGGMSPIVTLNQDDGKQTNVSTPFEYFVVPAGLFYINTECKIKEQDIKYQSHNTIDDDLYNKLFTLIQEPKKIKAKKTRSARGELKDTIELKKHKKTRKQK